MSCSNEVIVLYGEIVHRHDGKVAAQGVPSAPVVEGDVNACLCAHVQKALPFGVLTNAACEVVCWQVAGDGLPCRAVVGCLEQEGPVVIELVARAGQVRCGGIVRRDLDHVNARPLLQVRRRNICPVRAAVARDVDEAVVRACPEYAFLVWRFEEREYGAVGLRPGRVTGDVAAGWLELVGIVAS